MLTKNGKVCLFWGMQNANSIFKKSDGTNLSINLGMTYQGTPYKTIFNNSISLELGDGSTEPVESDLDLENPITDLTELNSYNSYVEAAGSYDKNYIWFMTKTVRNDTSDPIIVSEIGIVSTYEGRILIARDVISPVTIKPGEAYTFTMYIG